jgi:hypothetical protein
MQFFIFSQIRVDCHMSWALSRQSFLPNTKVAI